MAEGNVKLRIEIEPEMSEEKQGKVLNQINQIKEEYSKAAGKIIEAEGLDNIESVNRFQTLGEIGTSTEITSAVKNLGRVFAGVTQEMGVQLKRAFDEPVTIFQKQMSFITRTYNKTHDWSNKTINDVTGAQAFAVDYAKRINQMAEMLTETDSKGVLSKKAIGSADSTFFKHFDEIRTAYLAGIEELQHKGNLPKTAGPISDRIASSSSIYKDTLNKIFGSMPEHEAKAYTKFMTSAALPFYYNGDTEGKRASYIKTPDSATPYGHLPEAYQKLYLQSRTNRVQGNKLQYASITEKQKERFVDDSIFAKIQDLAENDKTGVINELAINAGLVNRIGHKLTWRNRGSEPQVQHFLASLPMKLEELKSGGLQYREDSLEADRWNRRSVAIDKAIKEVSEYGIEPKLIKDVEHASSAPYNGKEATMKTLGFPKSYIIPKTTIDEKGNLIYREPTPEEIRVPKGQKAGVETKNQKFVSASDSAMMRMLRDTAVKMGYMVDEELGYYTDKQGRKLPLMTKVPLSELWQGARNEYGWFPEGGYSKINKTTQDEASRIAGVINKSFSGNGPKYGDVPYSFGFLNEEDMFFIPHELRETHNKAARAAGIVSAFEAGNATGLMKLPDRESLVKQINNVKSFNTPSHGEEEYYDVRKTADRRTGVNPQYMNWTALSTLYQMKTGNPMTKENILDSLAFVKPGGLFDEGFQGRAAGPVIKFAAVLGDLPKTLKESGIISNKSSFGEKDEFIVPSAALDAAYDEKKDEYSKEAIDLFRYYYGTKDTSIKTPQGKEISIPKMEQAERAEFEKKWMFNAADDNIDIFFADTSIKDKFGSRYLPTDLYKTRIANDLMSQKDSSGKRLYTSEQANKEAELRLASKQPDEVKDGLVRLNADEFKRNLDATISFYGGIAAVREAGAFETNKSYMPASMAQSLNLPYSAYAESIKNYEKAFANWKDPGWVQRHGFAAMPEYQREMEKDPSFMSKNEGAKAYIQRQVDDIREHMRKGELSLTTPGYSAIAGLTTGMALDFVSELTGNKVDKNSEIAPLFKSALLDMYNYDELLKNATTEKEKEELKQRESEYRETYDAIMANKYFIAPGLKRDGSQGAYKAVAERFPAAMGTAVAGRNLYYNADGSVNTRIQKALEASGASKDVFYVPPEAMYKMNTGDFDGDTVWAYVSKADEWLKGVENVDERLSKVKVELEKRKKIQESEMSSEKKEIIENTFGDEVLRASFLSTYSKGAMGLGSAVIRNALQMPEGPEKDAALLEGMNYYDLATSEIKKKGITNAKLGPAGFSALLVGQNFDRLMRNVYAFENADDESKKDLHFPSIFKSNIGSVNDMEAIGTISMNQSTARAAGGSFSLRKKMGDYVRHNYDMGTDLGRAAEWYSRIRLGDLTGEHFVTDEDISSGYDWLTKIKQEQLTKGTAAKLYYDQQIHAFETALKFMESDNSMSQKNIEREIKKGTESNGTMTERAQGLAKILSNQSYNVSPEIYDVLDKEKEREIENQKKAEALQKDERFKEVQDKIFSKYNPNYPNGKDNWSAMPRKYSVTATEPWFDANALPKRNASILQATQIDIEPGDKLRPDGTIKSKRYGISLFDADSSFGNYARKVEAEADEIVGGNDSLAIAIGDYMHKSFENFWTNQIKYKSNAEKYNEEHKGEEDVLKRRGYNKTELDEFSKSVQDNFTDLLTGKRSLDGIETFASRLDKLGFEAYKDTATDMVQVRPKTDVARSTAEFVELQDEAKRANEKLRVMQSTNIQDETYSGSLGNLVRYLYGQAGNLRVVGIEGTIYDKNKNVIHTEKDEETTYTIGEGENAKEVKTHAKPDAVFEIDGQYYILDYKSRQAGAKDSIFQSMLYQKQYEERAKKALEENDTESPFAQFGYLDENNNFVSKFGGVLGFNARGNTIISYSKAHEEWKGREFIDVLQDEYIKAIGRKREDLETGHYVEGQLELYKRYADKELVKYAKENNLLPSEIAKASKEVSDAQERYESRKNQEGYQQMSSAETDFYIARYAQDKDRLAEIEKNLNSENSRLWRKNNPYSTPYDRFAGIQEQINSLLGDETLDRMIEVYNNSEDIQDDIRNQMTHKSNAITRLANLRSEYAVEDVEDARQNIMSSLYGIDYNKGGQGLINIWQQLNKARATKEGLLTDPDIYDSANKIFRTKNDAIENPEKYKTQEARDTERIRSELAQKAEERYNEATDQYQNLLGFVNSVGMDKIIKTDEKEGQEQLQKIIAKPLELKSIDNYFSEKVDALIGYVEQKQAYIDRLTKMADPERPGADKAKEAAREELRINEKQQAEALEYLKNPYSLVDIMNREMGVYGSEITNIDKINKTYEEQKKFADIRLAIAKEDEETLRKLGFNDEQLIQAGIGQEQTPNKTPMPLKFSPYDNEIVELRNKKKRTTEEQDRMVGLIQKRVDFFSSAGVIPPLLPTEEDQYAPYKMRKEQESSLTKEEIEEKTKKEQEAIQEKQKRIFQNVKEEQTQYDSSMKYWDLWKTQNLNYADNEKQINELSLQNLIGIGDTSELRKLSMAQQIRAAREKIVEAQENGKYKLDETERSRIRNLLSDEAIDAYVNNKLNLSEEQRLNDTLFSNKMASRQRQHQYEQYNRNRYGRTGRFAGYFYQQQNRAFELQTQIDTNQHAADKLQARINAGEFKGKDLENAQAQLQGFKQAATEANAELQKFKPVQNVAAAGFHALSDSISSVVQRLGRQYFYKVLNEAKRFVQDFNKQMTTIQMITLKSDDQMSSLGDGLIKKAKDLKISISEISQSAATLYRQGLSDEEVNERLDVISKFSKVSGTKVDAATKLITVAMNTGLVSNATEASDIVTALGDNAATNAAEIEKGIEKAGAAAAADGTTFGQLAAMLTAITSTTQIGGNVAGRTLNTIFGRMNKIGTNELIYDENGNTVSGSAVAKLLKAQGVETYDAQGNKRSSFEVLYDLSKKWEGMSDATQQQLASQIAGTRQYSNFAAIMQGMSEGKIDEYLGLIGESSGITDKKYDAYLNSLEASLTNLKNTFDGLINDLTESDALSGMVNGLSNIVQGLDNVANSAGGLQQVVGLMIALAAAMAAIKSGNGIAMAIGAVVAGVTLSSLHGIGSQQTASQEYKTVLEGINKRQNDRQSVIDRFKTLNEKGSSRTSEEEKEFQSLKIKMSDMFDIEFPSDDVDGFVSSLEDVGSSAEAAAKATKDYADAISQAEKLNDEKKIHELAASSTKSSRAAVQEYFETISKYNAGGNYDSPLLQEKLFTRDKHGRVDNISPETFFNRIADWSVGGVTPEDMGIFGYAIAGLQAARADGGFIGNIWNSLINGTGSFFENTTKDSGYNQSDAYANHKDDVIKAFEDAAASGAMSEIRDEKGNLVEQYSHKDWENYVANKVRNATNAKINGTSSELKYSDSDYLIVDATTRYVNELNENKIKETTIKELFGNRFREIFPSKTEEEINAMADQAWYELSQINEWDKDEQTATKAFNDIYKNATGISSTASREDINKAASNYMLKYSSRTGKSTSSATFARANLNEEDYVIDLSNNKKHLSNKEATDFLNEYYNRVESETKQYVIRDKLGNILETINAENSGFNSSEDLAHSMAYGFLDSNNKWHYKDEKGNTFQTYEQAQEAATKWDKENQQWKYTTYTPEYDNESNKFRLKKTISARSGSYDEANNAAFEKVNKYPGIYQFTDRTGKVYSSRDRSDLEKIFNKERKELEDEMEETYKAVLKERGMKYVRRRGNRNLPIWKEIESLYAEDLKVIERGIEDLSPYYELNPIDVAAAVRKTGYYGQTVYNPSLKRSIKPNYKTITDYFTGGVQAKSSEWRQGKTLQIASSNMLRAYQNLFDYYKTGNDVADAQLLMNYINEEGQSEWAQITANDPEFAALMSQIVTNDAGVVTYAKQGILNEIYERLYENSTYGKRVKTTTETGAKALSAIQARYGENGKNGALSDIFAAEQKYNAYVKEQNDAKEAELQLLEEQQNNALLQENGLTLDNNVLGLIASGNVAAGITSLAGQTIAGLEVQQQTEYERKRKEIEEKYKPISQEAWFEKEGIQYLLDEDIEAMKTVLGESLTQKLQTENATDEDWAVATQKAKAYSYGSTSLFSRDRLEGMKQVRASIEAGTFGIEGGYSETAAEEYMSGMQNWSNYAALVRKRNAEGEEALTEGEKRQLEDYGKEFNLEQAKLEAAVNGDAGAMFNLAKQQYQMSNQVGFAANDLFEGMRGVQNISDFANLVGEQQVANWSKLLESAPQLTKEFEDLGFKFDDAGNIDVSATQASIENAGGSVASALMQVANLIAQQSADYSNQQVFLTTEEQRQQAEAFTSGSRPGEMIREGYDENGHYFREYYDEAVQSEANQTAFKEIVGNENVAAYGISQRLQNNEWNAGLNDIDLMYANALYNNGLQGYHGLSSLDQYTGLEYLISQANAGELHNIINESRKDFGTISAMTQGVTGADDWVRATASLNEAGLTWEDANDPEKAAAFAEAIKGIYENTDVAVSKNEEFQNSVYTTGQRLKTTGDYIDAYTIGLNKNSSSLKTATEAQKQEQQLLADIMKKQQIREDFKKGKAKAKDVAGLIGSSEEYAKDKKNKANIQAQLDAQMEVDESTIEALGAGQLADINAKLSEYYSNESIDVEGPKVNITGTDGNVNFDALTQAVGSEASEAMQSLAQSLAELGIKTHFETTQDGEGAPQVKLIVDSLGSGGGNSGGGGGGKSAADKLIEEQKHKLQPYLHKTKMLQIEEQSLIYAGDRSRLDKNYQKQIKAQQELLKQYMANIEELKKKLKTVAEGSKDWYTLRDAIMAAEEAAAEVNNQIENIKQKKIIDKLNEDWEQKNKPGKHKITMLETYAQGALSNDAFGDYETFTLTDIDEKKKQKAQNEKQIEKLKKKLAKMPKNSPGWQTLRDQIYALEEENAQLDNDITNSEHELNTQRLSQTAKVLQQNTQAATHNQTLAQTYGNMYQQGGYRKQYDEMLGVQMASNESIRASTEAARESVLKQIEELQEGTTQWYEAQAALFKYEETLAQCVVTQQELNRAMAESKMDKVNEDYEDATREVSHVNDMLSTQAQYYLNNGDYQAYYAATQRIIDNLPDMQKKSENKLARLRELYSEGMANGTLDPVMQRQYLEAINKEESNLQSLYNQEEVKKREKQKVQVDELLEKQNREKSDYDHNQQLLQYQTSKYQTTGELTNYGKAIEKDSELREGRIRTIKNEIEDLERQKDAVEAGSNEEKRLVDQIKKLEEERAKENAQLEKNNKLLEDNKKKILQVQKALENAADKEIENEKKRQKEQLAANVSMQNSILEVLKKRLQEEWNLKKKDLEKEKESLNEYKKLINERFNYRRKAAQQADKDEELAEYRRQLALIEADPSRTKDAKELRRKIEDLEKEQAWTIAEDELANETQRIDDNLEGIDKYVSYNEEKLNELLSNANNFATEINDLLSGSFEDSYKKIMDFMEKENTAFINSLPDAQKQMVQSWEDTWKKARDIVDSNYEEIASIMYVSDANGNIELDLNKDIEGKEKYRLNDWDEVLKWFQEKDRTYQSYIEHGDLYNARLLERSWRELYDNYVNALKDDFNFEEDYHEIRSVISEIGQLGNDVFKVQFVGINSDNAPDAPYLTNSNQMTVDFSGNAEGMIQEIIDGIEELNTIFRPTAPTGQTLPSGTDGGGENGNGNGTTSTDETLTKKYHVHGTNPQGEPTVYGVAYATYKEAMKAMLKGAQQGWTNLSISYYKHGGLVDYTGPAWVDGTPTQPEAFLNATDTKNMRALLDALNYVKVDSLTPHLDSSLFGNSNTIGDINITINAAEFKSDEDYDKVAKRVGQAFSRELARQGLNLSGYAF